MDTLNKPIVGNPMAHFSDRRHTSELVSVWQITKPDEHLSPFFGQNAVSFASRN